MWGRSRYEETKRVQSRECCRLTYLTVQMDALMSDSSALPLHDGVSCSGASQGGVGLSPWNTAKALPY